LSTAHALFDVDGPVATLTLNRPEVRNAMTWEMYDALAAACDRVDTDDSIRVFVVRGGGDKAFVAGTDISQFEGFTTADDGLAYEARLDGVIDRLERVVKPTIAQVQGVAAGGGCAIALTCDLRIATHDASFGVPIARTLGNCLSAATCARLVDMLGVSRAKELLFTGRFLSATEAHAMGLVARLVAHADLDRAVAIFAREIAANAPLTIRVSKEMIRRILANRRMEPDADRDLIARCYGSADFREGVAAFRDKRPPRWSGR
jgi:enoyl-CoA hydratase/carnithine racemase